MHSVVKKNNNRFMSFDHSIITQRIVISVGDHRYGATNIE
jgi:hypothetical protein